MSSLSYADQDALWTGPLEDKLAHGRAAIQDALAQAEHPVVLYTGGKDSTVVLWLVHQTAERPQEIPTLLLDHGLHFPETWAFVERVQRDWDFELAIARNDDVLAQASAPGSPRGVTTKHHTPRGEPIAVDQLNDENRHEIRDVLGYEASTFPFSLDTEVGNHLLKTVAMRRALRAQRFDYAFVGIRWDEHSARADEECLSPRSEPPHTRVHPILPLTEADIWAVIRQYDLPTHPLYAQGYRSLDS
ncbi:MAG: phosphoadenosine phosphosulfate reductase family protein, partial [Salinibacter sp.]